jgi:chromosome segregation ATPase
MTKRRLLDIAVVIAAAVCAALLLVSRHETESLRTEVEQLRQEVVGAKAELDSLRRERDELIERWEAEAPEAAEAHRAVKRTDPPPDQEQQVRLLNETKDKLAAAQVTIQELQHRIEDFELRLNSAGQESNNLRGAANDISERLDRSNRLVAALQDEMKSRNDRLVQLELQNKELRKKSDDLDRRQERADKAQTELEEITRRREVFMTNILRRYREVTDLYRSLSLRLDNPRDVATGGSPLTSDLARIQNAITLADEDMRQVQRLNDRAESVLKQLSR